MTMDSGGTLNVSSGGTSAGPGDREAGQVTPGSPHGGTVCEQHVHGTAAVSDARRTPVRLERRQLAVVRLLETHP
jgi:hypothetical protein